MNENKRSGNLVLILMASMLVLTLVFMAAFFFSRENETVETTTPSPTEQAGNSSTPVPTDALQETLLPTSTPDSDGTAPVVVVKRVVIFYGTTVSPEDFIESIEDESEYTVEYASDQDKKAAGPDFNKYGLQEVMLVVTDAAGNVTTVSAVLNILNLVTRMELQIGTEFPDPEMFLVEEGSEVSYVTDTGLIDVNQAGEYGIDLLVDGDVAMAIVSIGDTKAPVVVTRDAETLLNNKLTVQDFIVEIIDDTAVSVIFYSEPKWDVEGEQVVKLIVSDAAANITTAEAKLTVKKDTSASGENGTEP